MTNVEIEDVLSSIRRLVSDDHRPTPAAFASRRADPGKLLLTPALRVEPPVEEAMPARGHLLHLHPGLAAVSEAPSPAVEDWQPEGDAPEAPHTFVEDLPEEWQTGDVLEGSWAQEAMAEAELGEVYAAAMPAEVDEPTESELQEAAVAEPASAFDEETLRDIVRAVLREELQGPLGERITRNVRKLVRAEINRARVSRDIG